MQTRTLYFLLIIINCLTIGCKKSSNPVDPNLHPPKVQDLNEVIHPLNGSSPNLNDSDLKPLSHLGNSKIVGLGEATHGTKEFFQLKHRIFKYLVENYNFKVFGFECDMAESIFFDRYVTTGEGDLDYLMQYYMQFWTWRTEEVRDLLVWMREYNEGKTDEAKIHYLGFDCQFMGYQPGLLMDYFEKVKPEFVDKLFPTLDIIGKSHVIETYSITTGIKNQLSDSVNVILSRLDEIEDELILNSSNFEYQLMRKLLRNIQQSAIVIHSYSNNDYSKNYRELYMAENALWLSNLFGQDQKIALWAHNLHIGNFADYARYGSLGYELKKDLGNSYQTVGFSFSQGEFNAFTQFGMVSEFGDLELQTINTAPMEETLNNIFYQAKYDNFILNISDIPAKSEFGNWISSARPFISVGSAYNGDPSLYYRNIFLRDCFDVLINYDVTTASVLLQ